MKLYTLTDEEVKQAKDFAKKLIAAGKTGKEKDYVLGTLGEMGYGKHIKAKVNLEVYARGVGDKGADFKNVQVKTSTWTKDNKELKIKPNDSCLKNPNVTKLVLMHTTLDNPNKVYLVGTVSKANFIKKHYYNTIYGCKALSEYNLDERF